MAYTSQKPAHLDKVSKDKAPFNPGDILRLNGRMLAVYKQAVPEKEYHIVLMLAPGGAVVAKGIALEGYEIDVLGAIAHKYFEQLQSEMQWERDLIVFHCYSYEDVAKVPRADGGIEEPRNGHRPAPAPAYTPAPAQARAEEEPEAAYEPAPPRPAEVNGNLRRGQRLQIRFGDKGWEAVYWGKDDQGQVVAHKTHENWDLMHLDLKRFASTMQVEPEPDPLLVQEIEQSLLNKA